jgi:DNA invertase Pin-like site-specific DNA recombinase
MTKVGIYVRISDDRAGSGLGVARQEEDCRTLAATKGWEVADVYTDNDLSAYSGKRRPSYERLLEDLRAKTIAGVVAWHPDRLHRRPVELEAFIDLVNSVGAVIETVQAGEFDLSTATGRMTARIVGAVARHESEHKSERHKAKARQLARAGKNHGGGTRPYGFDDDRFTIRETEAELIRDLARRVIAGDSLRSLAAELNQRAVKTATGVPWSTIVLRRMLTSGRITGLREHEGEVVAEAVWPAILDRGTWETVRGILLDPGRRLKHTSRRYLLTGGIAVCGLCQASLVARPKDDKRRCYVCASGPNFYGCGKIRMLADWLEGYVVEVMLAGLEGDGLARAMAGDTEKDVSGAGIELQRVEARLDQLAGLFAAGRIEQREWLEARQGLQRRKEMLVAALATAGQRSALVRLAGDGGVRARWEAIESFDTRHAVVSSAIERVIVGPAVRGRNFFDPSRLLPPLGDILWRV